jgi:hypothetical protein
MKKTVVVLIGMGALALGVIWYFFFRKTNTTPTINDGGMTDSTPAGAVVEDKTKIFEAQQAQINAEKSQLETLSEAGINALKDAFTSAFQTLSTLPLAKSEITINGSTVQAGGAQNDVALPDVSSNYDVFKQSQIKKAFDDMSAASNELTMANEANPDFMNWKPLSVGYPDWAGGWVQHAPTNEAQILAQAKLDETTRIYNSMVGSV